MELQRGTSRDSSFAGVVLSARDACSFPRHLAVFLLMDWQCQFTDALAVGKSEIRIYIQSVYNGKQFVEQTGRDAKLYFEPRKAVWRIRRILGFHCLSTKRILQPSGLGKVGSGRGASGIFTKTHIRYGLFDILQLLEDIEGGDTAITV